jgi:hypothetical protein
LEEAVDLSYDRLLMMNGKQNSQTVESVYNSILMLSSK